ncbi:MAG: hypothetical protein ACLQDI_15950 [Syntrophobacteraceae bacterium]
MGGPMSDEDRAFSFLQLICRSQRGQFNVYLGYGPRVGKTWQMLLGGRRLKQAGIDALWQTPATDFRQISGKNPECPSATRNPIECPL